MAESTVMSFIPACHTGHSATWAPGTSSYTDPEVQCIVTETYTCCNPCRYVGRVDGGRSTVSSSICIILASGYLLPASSWHFGIHKCCAKYAHVLDLGENRDLLEARPATSWNLQCSGALVYMSLSPPWSQGQAIACETR